MPYFNDSSMLLAGNVLFTASIAVCIGIFLYVLVLVMYRLYFHPLVKIPGPLFARITDWYSVIINLGDDRHLDFYKLHQRYGPVVRYGPSRVSFNTVSGVNQIYGLRSNVQKSTFYGVYRHYFPEPCTVTSLSDKEHAPKRKLVSQALSDSAIKAMEDLYLQNIRLFCDQMKPSQRQRNLWGDPCNIARWTSYLTFDIMSTLCFSDSYNMLTSDKQRWISSVTTQALQGLNVVGHMQWLLRYRLDELVFPKLVAANKRFLALSRIMSEKRYQKREDIKAKDAFYFLQNARDPATGAHLTNEQLIAEAGLLIGAGSDTTSVAIASVIFYLLKNPSCLKELQKEIRPKFTDVEQIRGSTISSSTYLRACVDEALRMTPSVGGILAREVLPGGITIPSEVLTGGTVIHKVFIPAGMDVGVPIYAIHHNEHYFPKPFIFTPERWISDPNSPATSVQAPETVALARSAFCAFSSGAWGCLGKSLAYKEITITVARLVWLFEWRIAPGTNLGEGDLLNDPGTLRHRRDEYQAKDCFIMALDGPMVQFRESAKTVTKS